MLFLDRITILISKWLINQATFQDEEYKGWNASGSVDEYSAVKHEVEYADLSHAPKGGGGRPNKPVIREH